jgi:hypothetical protein
MDVAISTKGCLMKHGQHRDKASGKPYGKICAGAGKQVMEPRAQP